MKAALVVQSAAAIKSDPTHASASVEEGKADKSELEKLKERIGDLEDERNSLVAEVKLVKIARGEAEQDAQLFRDLYNKASAYASELNEKNVILDERVTLAERQVAEGLALIRKTYESQNRKLLDELSKAESRLRLIQNQAFRTDDDVRARAAQYFEEQAKVALLESRISTLKGDQATIVRHRNELLVSTKELEDDRREWISERSSLSFELRRMKVELARYAARERSVKQALRSSGMNDFDDDDEADADGESEDPEEDDVYVCQWATNDSGDWCGALLSTQQVCRYSSV